MSTVSLSAPAAVRWIVRTLEEAGFETWAVGGAVRDRLLGRESGDWDLATRARPPEVRRVFRRTVPIGVDHGTVGVLARDGTLYEVTTFRRDVETFGRRAVVEFADEVEEDLGRRDFTINALAFHPLREELRDPFGGMDDLRRKRLRTVGEPSDRFAEDYLRVLRGLRFSGEFGLTVEPATWTALCYAVGGLSVLSAERVREELMKVLGQARRPSGALSLYAASGALAELLPELEPAPTRPGDGAPDSRWDHALLTADVLPPTRPLLRLAAVVHPVEGGRGGAEARRSAAALLLRLRFSNAEVDRVSRLVEAGLEPPDPAQGGAALRRWLSATGPELLPDLGRLWVASARVASARGRRGPAPSDALRALRREARSGAPLSVGDLEVDGRDLIGLGLRPGPRFGDILDALLERVLEDPSLNERERLLAAVEELAGNDGEESQRG